MADEETLAALFGGMNGASNSLRPASSGYADLNQFQNTIKQNDIYGDVANLIGGARFNTSTWSPGQTAGVTAGQAFLNTILKGLGQRSEARQMNAVSKVLPELYNNPGNVSVPEGVDSDAFEAFKLASVRNKLVRDAALAQEEADYKRKIEGNIRAELFSQRPDLAAKELKMDLPAQTGMDLIPKALQDNVLTEQGYEQKKAQALKYIDDKFERAKQLTGGQAAVKALSGGFIPTPKGDELEGLADSVILQIDNMQEKEINTDVRNRMLSLAAKWYDTPETIERKKNELKKLVASLSKPTPTLEQYGLSKSAADGLKNAGNFASQEVPAGMKLQRNKKTGETRLVPQ